MNKKELESVYRNRVYFLSNSGIYFYIGEANEELDHILEDYDVTQWAFITAWNPGGNELSMNDNLERQSGMLDLIHDFIFMEGKEEDRSSGYSEDGFFILGISLSEAKEIGRSFGQTAIIYGIKGEAAHLIML